MRADHRPAQSLGQEAPYSPLYLMVELIEVAFGTRRELNRPSQARAPSLPASFAARAPKGVRARDVFLVLDVSKNRILHELFLRPAKRPRQVFDAKFDVGRKVDGQHGI
jgi:hypothetical protein